MQGNGTPHFSFDTEALPERDRFPVFCEEIFRNVIGADISRTCDTPFRGSIDVRPVGHVSIIDLSMTDADMHRNNSFLGDGDSRIVVQLWRQGRANVRQGKHEHQIDQRAGWIIDNTRPARVTTLCASRFSALIIPRSEFAARERNVNQVGGAELRDGIGYRLLRSYMKEVQSEESADAEAGRLFAGHLVDLAAFALRGNTEDLEHSRGVRAARCAAILREIELRIADPQLSPATIARSLGITPRYVHRILEETNSTFSHHVLQKRLLRAAALLRDPRWLEHKVSSIASESGFNDMSYFNRSFRRYFGVTPSDMRRDVLAAATR